MKQWLRVSHINIFAYLKDGADAPWGWVTEGGFATSLGEEVAALPKADKGSGWPPKLPAALRLCVHTQKLVCYSTHSVTFLAWNYNSGTHYHVEKGTLGCITDIKEQFQNLVYELKLWAIKTYLDLHSESCRCCPLCPQSSGERLPRGGLKHRDGALPEFLFSGARLDSDLFFHSWRDLLTDFKFLVWLPPSFPGSLQLTET